MEITDLSKDPQRKNESPSNYLVRFKERALDCKDVISETSLVGICVSGLRSKYRLHIENHVILDFSKLMIWVKNTEASLSEADKEEFHGGARKWGNKPPFLKRKRDVNVVEQENKTREIPTSIPLENYQIDVLVKAWIEDGQLKLGPIERQSVSEEKKDPRYCLYHRRLGHPTSDCHLVRRVYHNKVQKGEIVQAAEKNPLPGHKSVIKCTAVEENPKPIVVHESWECSTESTQKEELVDGLIKSRVFRNLFESLEFE